MLNGEWKDVAFLSGEIQSTIVDSSGEPQEKIVKPSIIPIVVEADKGKKLTKVTVEAVSSDIDVDIRPEDIREGVEILGVVGTLEQKEDLDVELSEQEALLTELEHNIDNLPDKNIDLSETTASANDVLEGKEFYNANGEKVVGNYKDKFQWLCDNRKSLSYICDNMTKSVNLDDLFNNIDTSEVQSFYSAFNHCDSLEFAPLLNTSNVTNMSNMFNYCYSLKEVPQYNTSKVTNMSNMFNACENLTLANLTNFNMQSLTNVSGMFAGCKNLTEIKLPDTSNVTNFMTMCKGCKNLITLSGLNLIKATNVTSILSNCENLTNLTIKNVKMSITIASGTSYGHLLTLESLLNTIKELHTNTGTTTLTLTIGSANLQKLANVYVKLIDITEAMREQDKFIDNKVPFVQCESTDEGSMLIEEYITTIKKWKLA